MLKINSLIQHIKAYLLYLEKICLLTWVIHTVSNQFNILSMFLHSWPLVSCVGAHLVKIYNEKVEYQKTIK